MSATPNDGGPAFPIQTHHVQSLSNSNGETVGVVAQELGTYPGMTLRDWFAGMALQGLLACGHFTLPADDHDQAWMTTHEDPWDDETGEKTHIGRRRFDFPEAAWTCADAMLAARERKEDA